MLSLRGIYYARLFLEYGTAITVAKVTLAGGSTFQRKIHRSGHPYLVVWLHPGPSLAFTPAVIADSERLPPEQAVQRLGAVLQSGMLALASKCRPMTSSYAWKIGNPRRGEWERVGKLSVVDPSPIIERLKLDDIAADVHQDSALWSVVWRIPDGWPEDRVKVLLDELASLV